MAEELIQFTKISFNGFSDNIEILQSATDEEIGEISAPLPGK